MSKPLFDQCVTNLSESSILSISNDGKVAGYKNTDSAVRYHNPDPIYSAAWHIKAAEDQARDYSPAHSHDFPELNILAGEPGKLKYKIQIGDEERAVDSPATILVPPHTPHSANIIGGTGWFVVIRLMPEQIRRSYELTQ